MTAVAAAVAGAFGSFELLWADFFQRANGSLTGPWANVPGEPANFTISANKAVVSDVTVRCTYLSNKLALWPNDQYAAVVIGTPTAFSAGTGYGPAIRCSSSALTYYAAHVGGAGWAVVSRVAGVWTVIASASTPAFADGDMAVLAAQGSQFEFYKVTAGIWSLVWNGTDTSIASGSPGMSFCNTDASSSTILNWHGGRVTSIVASSGKPVQVTGLTAMAVSTSEIDLAWTATPNTTSYNIDQFGVQIASGVVGTSFAVTGLSSDTSYTFSVSAVNGSGEGPESANASARTLASGGTGYLAGAYNQMSYQGLSIVPQSTFPGGGEDAFVGTDSVTGFVQPITPAIWGGGTPPIAAQIQWVQDNPGDQTRQILTGALLPAGSLPGSGRTENYYRNTLVAAYDPNVNGVSGQTMQNQYILWPKTGNATSGRMYYHRQWMRFSSNILTAMAGGNFFVVSENKTGGSNFRTGLGFNTYGPGGTVQWYMQADGFPSGYHTTWQDQFDPGVYPIPVNQWFLMEFATRPTSASNGFAWAAINGQVLRSNFTYQSTTYTYVNGAHMGSTRPSDEDLNRIFCSMAYTSCARPPSVTIDIARFEIFESFPSDASTPHPS